MQILELFTCVCLLSINLISFAHQTSNIVHRTSSILTPGQYQNLPIEQIRGDEYQYLF